MIFFLDTFLFEIKIKENRLFHTLSRGANLYRTYLGAASPYPNVATISLLFIDFADPSYCQLSCKKEKDILKTLN